MSGFETGAIRSLKNNRQLRRGSGQKFKGNIYNRSSSFIPGLKARSKESKLIERANEKRKEAVNRQLLCLAIVAFVVSLVIMRYMN